MSVLIQRAGNCISVTGPQQALGLLANRLRYKHKSMYQGEELRARRRFMLENPHVPMNAKFQIETRLLYQIEGAKLYCGAGLRKRVQAVLDAGGYPSTYTDLRETVLETPQYERLEHSSLLEQGFRYKQDEVLAMIDANEGGLIQAPTGYGKTHLMSMLQLVYPSTRIMFVSSGLDLIRSTFYRLSEASGRQVGRLGDGYCELDKRILLCSADSLQHAPISKMGLILADEVHELATDIRIAKLNSEATDAKWFGFSASIGRRFDGADAVLEAVFGPILLDITYAEGEAAGVVAPINYHMVDVPPHVTVPALDGESWQKTRDGYWRNDWRNNKLAEAVLESPKWVNDPDPQILIMVSKVEHLFELRRFLPDFTPVYAGMDPKVRSKLLRRGLIDQSEYMDKEKRTRILRQFETGKLKRVIANHCWKKGIDPVHLKVFGRFDGETSSINSIQLPGRLSRIADGKSAGLLIDANDRFDPWAERRADIRERDYKKAGFHKVESNELNQQIQLASEGAG